MKKFLKNKTDKSDTTEDEQRRKEKDIWISQKFVEVLHMASKTYDYTSKTAAGPADLVGMCEDRSEFTTMRKAVIGLPALIQQEAEAKIAEAERKTSKLQEQKESESMGSIEQLMIATGLPTFNEEWNRPEHESMRYLAAIFELWMRKGMFPVKRPNIHNITIKCRCSLMELQKYVYGSMKTPWIERMAPPENRKVVKRKRKMACFDKSNTENISQRKKLKIRKQKLSE